MWRRSSQEFSSISRGPSEGSGNSQVQFERLSHEQRRLTLRLPAFRSGSNMSTLGPNCLVKVGCLSHPRFWLYSLTNFDATDLQRGWSAAEIVESHAAAVLVHRPSGKLTSVGMYHCQPQKRRCRSCLTIVFHPGRESFGQCLGNAWTHPIGECPSRPSSLGRHSGGVSRPGPWWSSSLTAQGLVEVQLQSQSKGCNLQGWMGVALDTTRLAKT